MDPFGGDYKNPESEFNVGVSNALMILQMKGGVHKAMWEKNYDAAAELLSSMSSELKAWFGKRKKAPEIDILKQLEKEAFLLLDSKASNKSFLLKIKLRDWRDYVLKLSSDVWFNKEKTNMFGDDFD